MKKSSEPFAILEGMFCVVKGSPVSAERAVAWSVYEAYDFASPMTYIVESVTVRRSSITKDLKRDQPTEKLDQNRLRTSVPEQSMPKLNPRSFRRCDIPYGHWSRQRYPSPPGRPSSAHQKQRGPQSSSCCTAGRFAGGVTSFRGLLCPRASQIREARNRQLRKALQRLNKSPKSPKRGGAKLGALQTHHSRSCNIQIWGPRVEKCVSMLSVARGLGSVDQANTLHREASSPQPALTDAPVRRISRPKGCLGRRNDQARCVVSFRLHPQKTRGGLRFVRPGNTNESLLPINDSSFGFMQGPNGWRGQCTEE